MKTGEIKMETVKNKGFLKRLKILTVLLKKEYQL